jgi:Fe-Mn family superoxide dismutase
MAFELPNLPYDYDALAPYMSRETLEYHHDKHHLAYVTNGNKLAEEAGLSDLSLEEIVKKYYGTNQPLFNNAGQHYNHLHFWKWLKKGGGGTALPAKLDAAIKSDLGGYDKFRADFIAAGVGQFGSGWAWLSVKNGKLEISKTPNGENRRVPDPRRRRLGTFLLHRLPQRPSEVPRSLRRQPDQLGLRARALRSCCVIHFVVTNTKPGSDAGFL